MDVHRSYMEIFSGSMTSECEKKHKPILFGVDLTQAYPVFSQDDHPLEASLGGETRANKEGHNEVSELQGSVSKSTSFSQGSIDRIFPCRYCSRKFSNSKAFAGHQNAHKKERTASKSNPVPNSLTTHGFQYPVVGQQPTHAMFYSNKQPHFDQWPHNYPIELASSSISSLKRPRNDIKLVPASLGSVKRARKEDPQQQHPTPGRMVTLSTEYEELDLSLHL